MDDALFQSLEKAADGAFVIDENQRIIFWNRSAQRILGYAPDAVLGRLCHHILNGRDERSNALCREHCRISAMAARGKPVTCYDAFIETASGQARWINISILTFAVDGKNGGSRTLVIHLFRYATTQKQSEQFVKQVLGAARQLDRGETALQPAPAPTVFSKKLTNRECQVLTLLVQGLGTGEIAGTLSISPATTRNHVQSILHKFGVHSRLEAVAYALEHGIICSNKTG